MKKKKKFHEVIAVYILRVAMFNFCFLLQMKMAPLGLDNLILVTDEARQSVYDTIKLGYGGVDSKSVSTLLLPIE